MVYVLYIAVTSSEPSPALLNWQVIHRKMPWSLVLLLGGGFAIAKACTVSGLSALIGHQLEVLGHLPGWVMVTVLSLMTAAVTEVSTICFT